MIASVDRIARIDTELAAARAGRVPEITLWDLVVWCEARHSTRDAIVLGGRRLSFGDLAQETRRVMAGLRSAGLERGAHLALIGTNSVEWVEVFLAAAGLGATVVPVNTRLTPGEMEWTVKAADAAWIVYMPRYFQPEASGEHTRRFTLSGEAAGVQSVASLRDAGPEDSPEPGATPHDVATILYTSGSTALPKGCMLTHAGIVRNACLHVERLGITAADRWFSGMPLFHAGGLVWGLTSILVSGACLVTQEIFHPGNALDLMEAEACTYHHGVDTMFVKEMAHPTFEPRRLQTVRMAASTGSPELLRQIHDVMGIPGIVSKWGITEGYGNLTLCSPADPLEKRLRTVGRGYPGIEYRISDPATGQTVPAGRTGEIQVRGCAMAGYYRDPSATARMIDADGWLHTGDLGSFDEDGYLIFAGRLKDMLKVGGENVAALEVENALLEHPDLRMAIVVACPHARLGEAPVAFVIPRDQRRPDADELDRHCRTRLAPFKVPARYVLLETGDLELTGSGKVVKTQLVQKARTLFGTLT
jgi:fatty-acyl-CoA synthase